jgi:hypothetical protein
MERILHHHHTNLNSNDKSMQVFVDGQHVSMKFLCSGKKKKKLLSFLANYIVGSKVCRYSVDF